jgi:hypothetical protein
LFSGVNLEIILRDSWGDILRGPYLESRIILLGRLRLDTSSRHTLERFEIYQPGPLYARMRNSETIEAAVALFSTWSRQESGVTPGNLPVSRRPLVCFGFLQVLHSFCFLTEYLAWNKQGETMTIKLLVCVIAA